MRRAVGRSDGDGSRPPSAKAMRRYAAKARRGNSDRFFETEEGWPLTPSGLVQVLKRLGAWAAVHVGSDKCRHTFGISYLRSGGSVFALQKLLGHSSLDTTLRYAALRYAALVTDDLVNEHRDHSLVASLVSDPRGGTTAELERVREPRDDTVTWVVAKERGTARAGSPGTAVVPGNTVNHGRR